MYVPSHYITHNGFVATHVHHMPNYMSYHKPMGGYGRAGHINWEGTLFSSFCILDSSFFFDISAMRIVEINALTDKK